MRKLIVCNIMSLDGYYTGPGNNVMVLPMDAAFDAYNAERLRAADTLLLGRTTYDGFRGFWPSVADDPAPQWTPTHREISRLDNAIDKAVISDSLTPEQTEPWHNNTRIISRADAPEQIAELKRQTGKDDRPSHIRRRHATLRWPAGRFASADRHTQVGWLGERTRTLRSPPPKDVNLLAQCLLYRNYRGGTPRRPAQNW